MVSVATEQEHFMKRFQLVDMWEIIICRLYRWEKISLIWCHNFRIASWPPGCPWPLSWEPLIQIIMVLVENNNVSLTCDGCSNRLNANPPIGLPTPSLSLLFPFLQLCFHTFIFHILVWSTKCFVSLQRYGFLYIIVKFMMLKNIRTLPTIPNYFQTTYKSVTLYSFVTMRTYCDITCWWSYSFSIQIVRRGILVSICNHEKVLEFDIFFIVTIHIHFGNVTGCVHGRETNSGKWQ